MTSTLVGFVAPQQRLFRPGTRHGSSSRANSVLQYSGFARAVLARSVHLRVVQPEVPECPRYAHVFPRDYPTGLEAHLHAVGVGPADVRAGATSKVPERPIGKLRLAKLAKLARRFAIVQAQLATYHPCRNQTDDPGACLVDAVGALK